MAKHNIWMPLYVGDYLADTGRLTTEQHGAYLLLLMEYWLSGPIPDDDEVLQMITKLPIDRWVKHRKTLSRMFQIVDGEWHHKRADQELQKAKELSEKNSQNAKKRWANRDKNQVVTFQKDAK